MDCSVVRISNVSHMKMTRASDIGDNSHRLGISGVGGAEGKDMNIGDAANVPTTKIRGLIQNPRELCRIHVVEPECRGIVRVFPDQGNRLLRGLDHRLHEEIHPQYRRQSKQVQIELFVMHERGIVGSCGWAGSKKCILMVI